MEKSSNAANHVSAIHLFSTPTYSIILNFKDIRFLLKYQWYHLVPYTLFLGATKINLIVPFHEE